MIQIQNLFFSYNRKKPLFRDLDLDISPGNIYGLLGKNGAGKTTLLKILSGLLFPGSGNVIVNGYRPKDRFPEFTREIYLVTEEFYLPAYRIEPYVNMFSPFYPRFDHDLFWKYMYEFKLPVSQKLSEMSYGQKKNFLLSFGLATDCKLLLLDEPTNGLDIPSKSHFRKIVASAIHDERSFIISTHQARDMENLIDPIIILNEGDIIFFQNYESINKNLAFSRLSKLPEDNNVVYSESSLGSYTVVTVNDGEEETNLNLETLFNAVINNSERINQIFKSQ